MKTYLFFLTTLLFLGNKTQAQSGSQAVIRSGDSWKYWASSAAPSSATWKGTTDGTGRFSELNWGGGPSPLGYSPNNNEDGAATIVPTGCGVGVFNCAQKYPTIYFRKTFTITNINDYQKFVLQYKRDDGIVLYVNGVELKREFMPDGPITHSTAALIGPNTDEVNWQVLDPGVQTSLPLLLYLRTGENVIAAEVHQTFTNSPTTNSTDLRFDLELRGQTKNVASRPLTSPAQSTSLVRGPYLQRYSDDPKLVIPAGKRTMTIRWSTNVNGTGRVRYKTDTGIQMTTPYQTPKPYDRYYTMQYAPAGAQQATYYDYSVTLTNLEPGTKYTYSIECGDLIYGDATSYFKTAPLIGSSTKTRIWALGDFGKSEQPNVEQNKVRDAFSTHVQANAATEDDKYIDLWLWLGDNAYGWGVTEQYQAGIFDIYDGRKDPTQRIMRQTPFFAAPGNHDYHGGGSAPGAVQLTEAHRKDHSLNHYYTVVNNMTAGDSAGMHSKHEEYYSFDHANIHFVSLDTYGYEQNQTTVFPSGSEQLKWLGKDLTLAQANPKIKWIVVFFHHPPYTTTDRSRTSPVDSWTTSSASHNSDTEDELINIREKLVRDVLEKYRVDLVLTGHSHTYQRSWPMRGHYGFEGEFEANKNKPTDFRAPVAATISSNGRYDCARVSSLTAVWPSSKDSTLIYRKSTNVNPAQNHIIYVVNGSGGGAEGKPNKEWPHAAMQSYFYGSGSMYLEVEGNRLDARFIDGDGKVRDQFKIVKDDDVFAIPVTDGTTRQPDCECTDAAGYTHYVQRTPAGSANLLLSINKDGNAIGTVGDGTFDLQLKGKPGATPVLNRYPNNYVRLRFEDKDTEWRVMNRYWTLKPTKALPNNSQVTIRHYYKEADMWAVGPFWGSHFNLKFLKYNDYGSFEAQNPDPTDDGNKYSTRASMYKGKGIWVYDNAPAASPSGWAYGSLGNDRHYGEFVTGRLMNGGGIGAFRSGGNPTGDAPLVMAGSVWKYYAGKDQAPTSTNWKGGGFFDDSNWPQGQAPLGYSPVGSDGKGVDGEVTRIPACPNDPNCPEKSWTAYFRKHVFFNSKAYSKSLPLGDQRALIINYKRDDGIAIYLNGTEIWRENLGSDVIGHSTKALVSADPESTWQTAIVSLTALREGENIIAAEVHQNTQSSSDLRFDLEVVVSPYSYYPMTTPLSRVAAEGATRPDEYKVTVYPNPTRDGRVSFSPALPYQSYILTDSQGKVLKQVTVAGTLEKLDLTEAQPGLYILVSQGEYGTKWFKLIRN